MKVEARWQKHALQRRSRISMIMGLVSSANIICILKEFVIIWDR